MKHLFKSLLLIVAASTGLNVAANTSHQAIITNNSKQPIDVSIGIACRARQESSSGMATISVVPVLALVLANT